MYARTHEILTREAARLAGVDERLIPELCLGAKSPDLAPDYDYKVYLTYRGRLRVRKTRIKHHEPNPSLLKKYIVEARHRWIKGRREEAARLVGRTLHYVGDSTIISPSKDEELHDRMERECSRMDPRHVIGDLNLFKPVGKRETLRVLLESLEEGPALSALEAVKRTLSTSFSIISSTLSPPTAPERFRELGGRCCEYFRERRRLILLLSLLLTILPFIALIFLSLELRPAIAFASLIPTIIPSMVAGVSAAILYRSRDMNTALYSARRVYGMLPWIIVGGVISGLITFGMGYMAIAISPTPEIIMTIIAYLRLFNTSKWKEIKDEIDWFTWR